MPNHAFLLVPGIGDFAPGLALENAAQAIAKRFDGLAVEAESSDEVARTYSRDYRLDSGAVRLSEYHWSGTFGKLRRLNPLRMLWRMFELFRSLPALGAFGSSRPSQPRLAMLGGWLLLLCAVVLTVSTILEVAAMAVENDAGRHQASNVSFNAYVLLVLVAVGGFLMFLLSGGEAAKRSGRAAQWLGLVIGSLLLFAYSGIVFLVAILAALLIWQTEPGMIVIMLIVVGPPFVLLMHVLLTIVDLLRDVVEYLAPSPDNSDNPKTHKIKQQVTEALNGLADEGFDDITLVAHSLGTVIATEVLLNWQPESATRPRVRLITCGSPLRRLIARLLPNRGVEPGEVFERLAKSRSFDLIEWVNLYRVLDPVGQPPASAVGRPQALLWLHGDLRARAQAPAPDDHLGTGPRRRCALRSGGWRGSHFR